MSRFIRLNLNCERMVGTSMKNYFHTWHELAPLSPDHWESLECAGGDFTERLTLALSVQDLDKKCMHLLMEITSKHFFPCSSSALKFLNVKLLMIVVVHISYMGSSFLPYIAWQTWENDAGERQISSHKSLESQVYCSVLRSSLAGCRMDLSSGELGVGCRLNCSPHPYKCPF